MSELATIEQPMTPAAQAPVITPMEMLNIAIQKGADLDKIDKLMDLQERYERAQSKKAFDEAMGKFQARMPVVPKKGRVSYKQTAYDHGRMEDAAKLADPILSEVGLSYRWTQKQEKELITVTFILTHKKPHFW